MNLKHRKQNEQDSGTLRCLECDTQYSSKWNLNNHIRDNHEKKQNCKWFREGHCRFPDNECWNLHEGSRQETTDQSDSEIKCHTCRKTFDNKEVMMNHRILEHKDKVKLCRDGTCCTRSKCWYRHLTSRSIDINPREKGRTTNEAGDEWVDVELDSENSDFQEAPKPPNPPTDQSEGTQSPQ